MSLEPKPLTEVMSEEDIVAAIEAAYLNRRVGELSMWHDELMACGRPDLYKIAFRRSQRSFYMIPNEYGGP